MPLRARCGSEDLLSWEYSDEAWAALKKEYKGMGLAMPCCAAAAIPKTSILGNRFFSHVRRGPCTSAPESSEHILSKTIIAQAAQEAGWRVTTEHREMGPGGTSWIADVLCEKDGVRFAFEVQWSPQTGDDTRIRQKTYAASGVTGIWLFRIKSKRTLRDVQYYFCERLQTPAAGISVDKENRAIKVLGFDVSLQLFVCNILNGTFSWERRDAGPHYWELLALPRTCAKCGHTTGDVSVIAHKDRHFNILHIYPFGNPAYGHAADLIKAHLTPDVLTRHKVERIIFRLGGTRHEPLSCNQCYNCGTDYGHLYTGESLRNSGPPQMSMISITLELAVGTGAIDGFSAWYCNGKPLKI